jgi:hypothetical protein
MHESQCKQRRNIKQQVNMTPPKAHDISITKSKDTEKADMLVKEFKTLNWYFNYYQ